MKLRVAIVGLGNIGNTHGRVYQARDDVEIVAACDIIKERADKASTAYGCPAFYSVQEMLNSKVKINAASMCTAGTENGGDHYTPTMELLEAGIPTLGEKPISNDVAKAAEMVTLGKKKRIKLVYDDPIAKVESVCRATALNISSMLQDVLKKKKTEIDYINGAIVRQCKSLSIPAPTNVILTDLVKSIESAYSKQA